MNSLLLNALNGCNHLQRPPVWMMRQAGRYLPEYRAFREQFTFEEMCHQSELATEVTIMPLKRFPLDAAILFSDILVILEAFDVSFSIQENIGPVIATKLNINQNVLLPDHDYLRERLKYVMQTIKSVSAEINVPLIGFAGAPFTVASYWIEGKPTKTFSQIKRWMWEFPEKLHAVLHALTEATKEYLYQQILAGASAIQIFESWASVLSPQQFSQFCVPYLKDIVTYVKSLNKPIILFARGSSIHGDTLSSLNPNAVSVDWSVNLKTFYQRLPDQVGLQGHFDPALLFCTPDVIRQEVIASLLDAPSYIANLGHGLYPETPLEGVQAFIDAVLSYKLQREEIDA